ncbi:hypothetical protein [Epilithonimonas sp.]|uniref:hypothetical protein n=1 Tax=Epilithonimonas sp. TaxID=2894511 RepID=UPI0035AE8DBD
MSKKMLLFIISVTVISCKKDYKYVEQIQRERSIAGVDREEKEEIFQADNDTLAYLEAFQKFIISKKVEMDMKKSLGSSSSIPLSFSVYDEKGNEITYIDFPNKEKRESEITERVFSLSSSIPKSTGADNVNNIDSLKVNELKVYFKQKKDEFSPEGKTWIQPKSSPPYTNQNGIYCYFQTENNIPSNLRFRVQYYSDEWLFFNKIQFSIDGKAYEYIPLNTETDSGDGGHIWEWFDENVSTNNDKELLRALANAKSAKMKFIGRQYYNIKNITKEQLIGIKRTIDYYKALGGSF